MLAQLGPIEHILQLVQPKRQHGAPQALVLAPQVAFNMQLVSQPVSRDLQSNPRCIAHCFYIKMVFVLSAYSHASAQAIMIGCMDCLHVSTWVNESPLAGVLSTVLIPWQRVLQQHVTRLDYLH